MLVLLMLTSGFEAVIPKEQKIRIDARMQKPRPAGSKYLRMPGDGSEEMVY
jgi:hypothetical protein